MRNIVLTMTHVWSLLLVVSQQGLNEFQPVVVNRSVLRSLSRTEVIVCKWPRPLRFQYYKNVMPDVSIRRCPSCKKVRGDVTYNIYTGMDN